MIRVITTKKIIAASRRKIRAAAYYIGPAVGVIIGFRTGTDDFSEVKAFGRSESPLLSARVRITSPNERSGKGAGGWKGTTEEETREEREKEERYLRTRERERRKKEIKDNCYWWLLGRATRFVGRINDSRPDRDQLFL